jgi:hypothetical protein
MIRGKNIEEVTVTPSTYRVGDVAEHVFDLETVAPMAPTD